MHKNLEETKIKVKNVNIKRPYINVLTQHMYK